jgi:hypothetical protein
MDFTPESIHVFIIVKIGVETSFKIRLMNYLIAGLPLST